MLHNYDHFDITKLLMIFITEILHCMLNIQVSNNFFYVDKNFILYIAIKIISNRWILRFLERRFILCVYLLNANIKCLSYFNFIIYKYGIEFPLYSDKSGCNIEKDTCFGSGSRKSSGVSSPVPRKQRLIKWIMLIRSRDSVGGAGK